MSKCFLCGNENAEYERCCLVVSKGGGSSHGLIESLVGAEKQAICSACLRKHLFMRRYFFWAVGAIAGLTGILLTFTVSTDFILFIVLGILIAAAGFYYEHKARHAEIRDAWAKAVLRRVPAGRNLESGYIEVGADMPADFGDFYRENVTRVSAEMALKLYNSYIATGAWKSYVEERLAAD